MREPLLAVYAEGNAAHLANPLRTTERQWRRLAADAAEPGFRLVTAHLGDDLVGYALWHTLPRLTRWWDGLLTPPDDPRLLAEDGRRTFACVDMTVRPACRGRGYAHLLHDALLADRPEPCAALVVEPDNIPLRTAYRAWGWRPVGDLRPAPDSPTHLAMLHDLPLDVPDRAAHDRVVVRTRESAGAQQVLRGRTHVTRVADGRPRPGGTGRNQ